MTNNFEKISKNLIEIYNKERKILEFTTVKTFNPNTHPNSSDFIQIGIRNQTPKDIIEQLNRPIAYDIAKAITFGERDYIISKLLDLHKNKQTNITDFEEIKTHVNSTEDKMFFAFIGIRGINAIGENRNITRWHNNHPIFGKGDFLILPSISLGIAKIIWVNDKIIGDNVLIFSKEDVEVIQKKVKHMLEIPGISKYPKYSSPDDYLDVSIGNKKNDYLDLYVKSIIKLNLLSKQEIFVFAIKKQS